MLDHNQYSRLVLAGAVVKKNFVFALGTVMVNYLLYHDEDKLNGVIQHTQLRNEM